MPFLIAALTLFAPLASFQTATEVQVPDKCYAGVIVVDFAACSATHGICGIEYKEVPCPDAE